MFSGKTPPLKPFGNPICASNGASSGSASRNSSTFSLCPGARHDRHAPQAHYITLPYSCALRVISASSTYIKQPSSKPPMHRNASCASQKNSPCRTRSPAGRTDPRPASDNAVPRPSKRQRNLPGQQRQKAGPPLCRILLRPVREQQARRRHHHIRVSVHPRAQL